MKIGIIGAGNIGASLARNLVAIGHDIKLANSKGADSIRDLARDIGATAVTKEDAVQDVAASSSRSRLPGMQISPVSSPTSEELVLLLRPGGACDAGLCQGSNCLSRRRRVRTDRHEQCLRRLPHGRCHATGFTGGSPAQGPHDLGGVEPDSQVLRDLPTKQGNRTPLSRTGSEHG